MDKLAKLFTDIGKLWGHYSGAYFTGIRNTLILAVLATLAGCLIGQGSVHTEDAFRALQAIGYRGAVALEGDPIGPDEEASFCKNLATVNQLIARYL